MGIRPRLQLFGSERVTCVCNPKVVIQYIFCIDVIMLFMNTLFKLQTITYALKPRVCFPILYYKTASFQYEFQPKLCMSSFTSFKLALMKLGGLVKAVLL